VGPAPPKGRNSLLKMQFGCVQTHTSFSVVSGPKFTRLFSWNAGGIAGEPISFRFCISCPIPEIFCRDNFGWFKFRSQQHHLVNQSGKLSEIAPKFHLGGSTCAPMTFLFVDQSSPPFLRPMWEGSSLINYFSDFQYVDPFRRYSRSKSIVV